jgi:hypothetical protein
MAVLFLLPRMRMEVPIVKGEEPLTDKRCAKYDFFSFLLLS